MATYLQGVTDYIPDYQPFQPDLNFYANLMQTKQTQYDTNWNQLNNLYGQLYGADLTHDMNIKKKDELLKQIDFNLKRVSGLDLSLEQNTNQAMQVFRPFYEDKYLMKDMAWTKNWKNTYGEAQSLQNATDPTQSSKYWNEGIKGLEYRRQMFKDATLDETLNMGNARYTPKVDVVKEYMDFAKKYDIGMVTQTPEGLYLVRKKNGEQLLPGLQQIFQAQYANRPEIQDFYREAAFVERMDYTYQNAEKFGGNKLEAEKDYIKQKYTWLKTITAQADAKAKDNANTARNLEANLQSEVARGQVNPLQKSYAERISELSTVTAEVEKNTSQVNAQINNSVGTATVAANPDDLFSNMELARMKVDAGFAAYKAGVDINNAAGTYAYSNYEIEYKPDAAAIAQFREANANARLDKSHQYKIIENAQAEQLKRQTEYQKAMVSAGRAFYKPDGTFEMNPQSSNYELIFKGKGSSGTTGGDKIQFDVLNQQIMDETVTKKAGPGVNAMMTYINDLVNNPNGSQFTSAQLGQVLNHLRANDPEIDKIIEQGKNYPNQNKAKQIWNQIYAEYSKGDKNAFLSKVIKYGDIYQLNGYMKKWSATHPNATSQQYVNDPLIADVEIQGRTAMAMELTRMNNAKKIQASFTEQLNFQAEKMRSLGVEISKQQINNAVQTVMNEYVASGYNWDAIRKDADRIDELLAGELGGKSFVKNTESKRDRSWYEHIPGVYATEATYDTITGNREDVTASWVRDILDKSYIELAESTDSKKGLQSFVETVSQGDDMVSLASDIQTVKVDVDYAGDFGYQATAQAVQDALALPMGDDSKFKFALSNDIPTNEDGEVDYAADGVDDNLARSLLRTLYSKLGDSKVGDFTLSTSRVAMENSKLGSTTFNIPRGVIEEVMKSMEGEYTPQQIAQMTDKIVQNGLTAIAPHEYWTHKLWNTSSPSATEIVLNNQDISYSHPHNSGNYQITKVQGVPGVDYGALIVTNIMDKDGSLVENKQRMDMSKTSGRKIEDIERAAWSVIVEQDKANLNLFRYFHQTNNQEAIDKAIKSFGISPNDPFWKY
jgi:hypothetical protein